MVKRPVEALPATTPGTGTGRPSWVSAEHGCSCCVHVTCRPHRLPGNAGLPNTVTSRYAEMMEKRKWRSCGFWPRGSMINTHSATLLCASAGVGYYKPITQFSKVTFALLAQCTLGKITKHPIFGKCLQQLVC
jgi:hypothetical protein